MSEKNQTSNNEEKYFESNEIKQAIDNIKNTEVIQDPNFQKKLIKLIIEEKTSEFALQIIDILNINYFEGFQLKILVKYIQDYILKYKVVPDYETINNLINEKEQDGTIKTHLLDLVTIIKEHKITDKQYVKDTSIEFFRKQALKQGLLDSVEIWARGSNYEDISKRLSEALKVGEPRSSGHNYTKDFLKRLTKNHRNPVSCLKGLDSRIGGGLSGGELGIILSPTGGGKSMVMVKFACTALEMGKKVIYYTFELAEGVIGNRFDSCLLEVPLRDVLEYGDSIKEKMDEIENKGGALYIREYGTGTASVNTLKSHILSLQREQFIPDVIFVDYADIMKTTSSFSEKRHALTSIYEGLRAMAQEFNIPIWSACQGGRQSFNKDKFGLDVISESIGKAQTADVIIGIARDDGQKLEKKANLIMHKNRNGEDGYTLPMIFDTTKIDIRIIEGEVENKVGFKGLNIEKHIKDNNQNIEENLIENDN